MAHQPIDPDALGAAKVAVVAYLDTISVFGISIGSQANDAEITTCTTNAIQAYLDRVAAPKI